MGKFTLCVVPVDPLRARIVQNALRARYVRRIHFGVT